MLLDAVGMGITVFVSIVGAGVVVHTFVSNIKTGLALLNIQIPHLVAGMERLSKRLEDANIEVLWEKVKVLEAELADQCDRIEDLRKITKPGG